ncbi:MAG: shikimate dehydrogenase [Gallionella sp.]
MTDKYAVIGNPISHSKSPQIHKMFAEQTGQDISYDKFEALLEKGGFRAKVIELRDKGYKGCNITVPFKHDAFNLMTEPGDKWVIDAEAVNTLKFEPEEKIKGYNTDGIGLVRDIQNNFHFPIQGKRILLMGTGGAAHGVWHPLLDENPTNLVIAYRTQEKAIAITKKVELHEEFSSTSLTARDYHGLKDQLFDLVINATSSGLSNEMPDIPETIFAFGALAYDMMYGRKTPFMRFAREHGAAVVSDGLGMLVEQAAESFRIWRGRDMKLDTASVIETLRKQQ